MKYVLLIILSINIAIAHPLDNLTENIKSFGIIEIYGQVDIEINYICNPTFQSCEDHQRKLISIRSLNMLLKEAPVLKSSSVCIDNSTNNFSIFITANHVCTEIVDSKSVSGSFKNNLQIILNNLIRINSLIKPDDIKIKFFAHIKNINHKKFKIKKVIKSIKETDLCLIEVEGNYEHKSSISKSQPNIGDAIYNIAIPEGIEFKDTLPLFTGIFSGTYKSEDNISSYLLSVPASQGSSGSPVFNEKGELIGIIYAAFKNFSHLSISSTLDQVKTLLK